MKIILLKCNKALLQRMDADDHPYHSRLPFSERPPDKTGTPLDEKASGSPPHRERGQMNVKDKLSRTYGSPERLNSLRLGTGSSGPLSLNALTPTSNLAGRLDLISLAKKSGLAEGATGSSLDSPTSDYASGNFPSGNFQSTNFPSLSESDHGYSSLPSMPSLAKTLGFFGGPQITRVAVPPQQTASSEGGTTVKGEDEKKPMEVEESVDEGDKASEDNDIERDSANISEPLLSLPAVGSMVRDESPGAVPVIGEDIEISTFSSSAPASLVMEQPGGGVLTKRGRFDADMQPSRKNPRLSPEPSGSKCPSDKSISPIA